MNFKIGKNKLDGKENTVVYKLVRHVPINSKIFDYYGKNLLPNFDALPTWKFSSPHNIQRKTPQNESCNNCHGNSKLFLTQKDVAADELKANKGIYFSQEELPKTIN